MVLGRHFTRHITNFYFHRDDEHTLILQYCQTLGGEGSPCSQPQSPAQILQAVEKEERGELERIIARLEEEQRWDIHLSLKCFPYQKRFGSFSVKYFLEPALIPAAFPWHHLNVSVCCHSPLWCPVHKHTLSHFPQTSHESHPPLLLSVWLVNGDTQRQMLGECHGWVDFCADYPAGALQESWEGRGELYCQAHKCQLKWRTAAYGAALGERKGWGKK